MSGRWGMRGIGEEGFRLIGLLGHWLVCSGSSPLFPRDELTLTAINQSVGPSTVGCTRLGTEAMALLAQRSVTLLGAGMVTPPTRKSTVLSTKASNPSSLTAVTGPFFWTHIASVK